MDSTPQPLASVVDAPEVFKVSAVVAMNRVGTIGHEDGIPWRMKTDMQHFRRTTRGGVVIMGRKTYDTLGRPLKNRHNIVLSRTIGDSNDENLEWVTSVEGAMESARAKELPIFIIGGGEIYRLFNTYVDDYIVTLIDNDIQGDTKFPGYPEDSKDAIGELFGNAGFELKEDLLEIPKDADNEYDAGVYKLTRRPAPQTVGSPVKKAEIRKIFKQTRENLEARAKRKTEKDAKTKVDNRRRNKQAKQARKRNRK